MDSDDTATTVFDDMICERAKRSATVESSRTPKACVGTRARRIADANKDNEGKTHD
jgi:hypothetical protein